MRAHDDEVGVHRLGFFEDFAVDGALPHHGRNFVSCNSGFLGDDDNRFFGGGALLRLEVGRHIFGEHDRRHRQDIDQPDRSVRFLRHHHRGRDRGLGKLDVGKIDRHQDAMVHVGAPVCFSQSVAAARSRGVTKRSSLPDCRCRRDHASKARSMTARPDVGNAFRQPLAHRGAAGSDQLHRDIVQARIVSDDEKGVRAARLADQSHQRLGSGVVDAVLVDVLRRFCEGGGDQAPRSPGCGAPVRPAPGREPDHGEPCRRR